MYVLVLIIFFTPQDTEEPDEEDDIPVDLDVSNH